MSIRRAESIPPEKPQRNRCTQLICVSWKVFTCVFSHVTLVTSVVAYCILGAFLFEHLEKQNEKNVKIGINALRGNVTEDIWNITKNTSVLHESNWTKQVIQRLQIFENVILKEMKEKGWDGSEDEDQVQWTWLGALFYSIIVITTIGYGHISPKTIQGKIATIFYAIAGIPLMLLCLSNIGDIMASSFRFLYWRVCCFVCTREPKKNRRFKARNSIRLHSGPSYNPPSQSKRNARNSQKSNDSGFPQIEAIQHAYSDTDCRYSFADEQFNRSKRNKTSDRDIPQQNIYERRKNMNHRPHSPNTMDRNFEDYSNTDDETNETFYNEQLKYKAHKRAQSLDRRGIGEYEPSVYCNKYAIKKLDLLSKRSRSMPRNTQLRNDTIFLNSDEPSLRYDDEIHGVGTRRIEKRREKLRPASSARIMSPMGFAVHRQARHLAQAKENSSDEEWETSGDTTDIVRPVPIWLCVFLVISYILGGAYLFSEWEKWSFLDSAYFCFITLTTIGFGDFVPAQNVKDESQRIILALTSLYLLFGIALLAMSFNLVQEEVIASVKNVAKKLGILKEEEYED